MSKVLAVRLDSDGDVLLTGPALRALAAHNEQVDVLVSPAGVAAAHLLPGVHEVLVYAAPWSGYLPPPLDPEATQLLVRELAKRHYDLAVVFTSFHQSPLPMALLARLAGIPRVAATSADYPGSLLDLRHRRTGGHEVEAALDLAAAVGAKLPTDDAGRLAVRRPLSPVNHLLPGGEFVVVHPGASVPARAPAPEHAACIVSGLLAEGWNVVVTGSPSEVELAEQVAVPGASTLAGRTTLAELAAVLSHAACVVVGNTGPAHLAAAVGTPVVSLFSPVVSAQRWAPYGVPMVLLGDQQAPCRDTRARDCPVPGHPCLGVITPAAVTAAVASLVGVPAPALVRGA